MCRGQDRAPGFQKHREKELIFSLFLFLFLVRIGHTVSRPELCRWSQQRVACSRRCFYYGALWPLLLLHPQGTENACVTTSHVGCILVTTPCWRGPQGRHAHVKLLSSQKQYFKNQVSRIPQHFQNHTARTPKLIQANSCHRQAACATRPSAGVPHNSSFTILPTPKHTQFDDQQPLINPTRISYTMVAQLAPKDRFYWSQGGEPHSQRRREILAKYGDQIRKLYGYDNRTAYQVESWSVIPIVLFNILTLPPLWQVIFVCLLHTTVAYLVRDMSLVPLFFVAWIIGGTCNQNLMCAQHELSHFLAYKKPSYNKILSIVSNMPLAIPMATSFRKYHQEHHSDMVRWGVLCCVHNAILSVYHHHHCYAN